MVLKRTNIIIKWLANITDNKMRFGTWQQLHEINTMELIMIWGREYVKCDSEFLIVRDSLTESVRSLQH